MVGTGLGAIATMASRLRTAHRWCVTGTPIGAGGLDDVAGLLRVLKMAPLDEPSLFRRVLGEPYKAGARGPLLALLRTLMWRNNKATAAADHPLPPRRLQVARLNFTQAEALFYRHVRDKTLAARNALLEHEADGGAGGGGGDRAAGNARRRLEGVAAAHLLQLRLACIHPQMTAFWRAPRCAALRHDALRHAARRRHRCVPAASDPY